MFVVFPSDGTHNRMDWRLLVKERMAKMKKKRNIFWGYIFCGVLGKYAGSPKLKLLSLQPSREPRGLETSDQRAYC